MKQTQTIPETFLGVGYTRDRAGLPLEAVRVPVPQPAADQVLIRVAASSLNPLEYKLADLNFMGRTPPVVLGLDLAGVVVAVGHGVSGVTGLLSLKAGRGILGKVAVIVARDLAAGK
jgi:NADPH:quinone reductase-like Zn-dependent oxidoreductase